MNLVGLFHRCMSMSAPVDISTDLLQKTNRILYLAARPKSYTVCYTLSLPHSLGLAIHSFERTLPELVKVRKLTERVEDKQKEITWIILRHKASQRVVKDRQTNNKKIKKWTPRLLALYPS